LRMLLIALKLFPQPPGSVPGARIAHAIDSVETFLLVTDILVQARIAHAIDSVETDIAPLLVECGRVLRMLLIALKLRHRS